MTAFQLQAPFQPTGDQPAAIDKLVDSLQNRQRFQTLLGATGTGKTFTIAAVIEKIGRPTLVLAHNKTLAAQLCNELRQFFPNNAVEYFISYYDYYQPEAYIPVSDTYIEKSSSINDEIDMLRHSATRSLFERRDVIVVASISCIYGLGMPAEYLKAAISLTVGQEFDQRQLLRALVSVQYNRNDLELTRGRFRLKGDILEIVPAYEDRVIKIDFFGDEIESIRYLDPLTGEVLQKLERISIYPARHFVTPEERLEVACRDIKTELDNRLLELEKAGKLLEAQRLDQRTRYDLEMLQEVGYCNGVENYSRHLAGRLAGEPPECLVDYFPQDWLLVVDESHVSVPQIRGMYNGDQSRKKVLIDHGFRLPSAADNRPLKSEEFWQKVNQCIFVSATPGDWELEQSENRIVEQIIRPTGVLDPDLDADKEGFLRATRSLIQTIGRAARHIRGQAILYGDNLTDSMINAIEETKRRRAIQEEYNQKHGIIPQSIVKRSSNSILAFLDISRRLNSQQLEQVCENIEELSLEQIPELIQQLEAQMKEAAKNLEFESAAKYRDRIKQLRDKLLNHLR